MKVSRLAIAIVADLEVRHSSPSGQRGDPRPEGSTTSAGCQRREDHVRR